MRHITQEGIDLIKRFEGFSPTVYFCPAGYPTIGYGHVVKKGEDFTGGITQGGDGPTDVHADARCGGVVEQAADDHVEVKISIGLEKADAA